MKKHLLFALASGALALSGCETSQIRSAIENATDSAIANTIDSSTSSSSGTSSSSNSGGSYSNHQSTVSKESFSAYDATRTINQFGTIRPVIQEKNPEGMTMVRLELFQKDSGARIAEETGFLFKVTPEGWFNEDYEFIRADPGPINSGKYYFKIGTNAGNAAGEVIITAGVTNIIQAEVE